MLTKAAALIVLACWGLAAMHCRLEVLPGLAFLQSCCAADSTPSSPKDCEDEGCCALEREDYLPTPRTPSVPAQAPAPALRLRVSTPPVPPACRGCPPESGAPPDLPRRWQFSFRAALPPRAPSLAS